MVALESAPPIGHNNPPEPTPLEAAAQTVADLYDEAKLWLDGAPVETQDHADGLAHLLDLARKAEKAADAARETEKAPHLAAGRAVDASFKPVIEDAKRMQTGLKAALQPWLTKLGAEKRERERAARAEADRLAREAAEARAALDAANLAQVEEAEAAVKAARAAESVASRAEKDTATAKGGARATGLRTFYEPELTDLNEAVRHYWADNRDAFAELVTRLAVVDVRCGKRVIPGFDVHERSRVV
jgi:hypothetical protein